MYFVVFWGLCSCTFEGPFSEEEAAKSYLADYVPEKPGHDGEPEMGVVVGPLTSCGEAREF